MTNRGRAWKILVVSLFVSLCALPLVGVYVLAISVALAGRTAGLLEGFGQAFARLGMIVGLCLGFALYFLLGALLVWGATAALRLAARDT